MHKNSFIRRLAGAAAVPLVGAVVLSGCAAQADTGEAPEARDDVTFALDWAPNTNHIGVYVAEALGYFDDASRSSRTRRPRYRNSCQRVRPTSDSRAKRACSSPAPPDATWSPCSK